MNYDHEERMAGKYRHYREMDEEDEWFFAEHMHNEVLGLTLYHVKENKRGKVRMVRNHSMGISDRLYDLTLDCSLLCLSACSVIVSVLLLFKLMQTL